METAQADEGSTRRRNSRRDSLGSKERQALSEECLIESLVEPAGLSSMQTVLFDSWPGLCKTWFLYEQSESDLGHGCGCECAVREVDANKLRDKQFAANGNQRRGRHP